VVASKDESGFFVLAVWNVVNLFVLSLLDPYSLQLLSDS